MQANDQIIQDFLVWVQAGHSRATVDSYRYALNRLREWLALEDKEILKLSISDIGHYQLSLENRGLKGSTRFHYATALRALWRWLYDQNRVSWNWKLIPLPDASDKQRMPALDEQEFGKIMGYFNEDIPRELRDKTAIALLFATGLRLSEMVSLDVGSLNMPERFLTVRTFKRRNHYRDLFWDDDTHRLLTKWLNVREGLLDRFGGATSALFIGLNSQRPGERIHKGAIQKRFRQLRTELRIDKKISAHPCRHGFGTYFGKRSGDVFSLQQLMGHANINHTHHYVHLRREDLRSAYNKVRKNPQKIMPVLTPSLGLGIVEPYAEHGKNQTQRRDDGFGRQGRSLPQIGEDLRYQGEHGIRGRKKGPVAPPKRRSTKQALGLVHNEPLTR